MLQDIEETFLVKFLNKVSPQNSAKIAFYIENFASIDGHKKIIFISTFVIISTCLFIYTNMMHILMKLLFNDKGLQIDNDKGWRWLQVSPLRKNFTPLFAHHLFFSRKSNYFSPSFLINVKYYILKVVVMIISERFSSLGQKIL